MMGSGPLVELVKEGGVGLEREYEGECRVSGGD